MQRALKLKVTVGKDHVVKLPSDFPEGPAEIIVIASATSATAPHRGRGMDIGKYTVPDDFNAPSPEIESAFEG